MDNVIYKKTIVDAHAAPDGETPTCVFVTQEANCFICWYRGYDEGLRLLRVGLHRDREIENAVKLGEKTTDELTGMSELVSW